MNLYKNDPNQDKDQLFKVSISSFGHHNKKRNKAVFKIKKPEEE